MRILLLEANEDDAVLIEELIADEDEPLFEVVVADRMSSAISHLENGDFDIILLDLSLPDSQGLATLKKIQTQAPWLPIIIMTGMQNDTLGDAAVREGAQDYLVKGQFDRPTLRRAIRHALERQRMMTHLRTQSQQLRASEKLFRQLVERNLDAVLIVDTDGMIRYVNPAAAALFKPRGDNLVNRPFGFILQHNGFSEITIEGTGGNPITAELRSVEIDWESEKAYLTTVHDITRRKELERESEAIRRKQDETKNHFIAHVSHEFRSPIIAAYQFTTLLLEEGQETGGITQQQKKYLETVLRNITQFRGMIEDLLDVTRAQVGKLAINPVVVSPKDLLNDCIDSMRLEAGSKKIILTDATLCELPAIYADYGRGRQILINLIGNAIKFTPQEGRVSVNAAVWDEDPNFVRIEVTDTGCGISAADREAVFERLYQAAGGNGAQKGLGLGLFICKQLVCGQGGKIWLESQLGKGSTFYFTLPVDSFQRQLA